MREGAIRRDQDRRCQRRGKHKRAHGSSAAHSGLEAGGKYGLVLLALPGAAGANVSGSTSAFVQSAAVNYLQGLGAAQVKQIADSLGWDPQAEAARENEVSDCNLGEGLRYKVVRNLISHLISRANRLCASAMRLLRLLRQERTMRRFIGIRVRSCVSLSL